MKVMYVVSTLKSSGPVNQLFNVINKQVKNIDFYILSLSPEPKDSRVCEFENIGVTCKSLNLTRLGGIFKAKKICV